MRLWGEPPGNADIAIVGGGAMGTSAAFHIATDPAFAGRVVVVERDPSFERAATSLTNSCIRQQFGTEVNIRMSLAGVDFIRNFRERLGGDPEVPEILLDGTGYLYLAATEAQAERLRAAQAVQAACGVCTRLLAQAKIAERFPWMETGDLILASHNPGDEGYFDGATMVDWMRRKAAAAGAIFVRGEVVALMGDSGRVAGLRLATGHEVKAKWVVNAAGTRAASLAALAGRTLPIEPRRRYTVVFETPEPIEPRMPLVIDPSGVHVRADDPGPRSFLAGFAPEDDTAPDHDDFAWADPFEERAWPALAARIPALERLRITGSWVGHYEFNTLDQNAVIGPDPEIAGLAYLCGFSGHGLQHSPAAGRALAEMLVHGQSRALDVSPLAPERILESRPFREAAVI